MAESPAAKYNMSDWSVRLLDEMGYLALSKLRLQTLCRIMLLPLLLLLRTGIPEIARKDALLDASHGAGMAGPDNRVHQQA